MFVLKPGYTEGIGGIGRNRLNAACERDADDCEHALWRRNLVMWEILFLLLLIVFVAAAIIAGALIWRSYVDSGAPGSGIFRGKNEKRLDVVEQATLDGRRRLVLIRRDDTEHLIMTGGPVDVVIETGIDSRKKASESSDVIATPAFSRQARVLGKASGDR